MASQSDGPRAGRAQLTVDQFNGFVKTALDQYDNYRTRHLVVSKEWNDARTTAALTAYQDACKAGIGTTTGSLRTMIELVLKAADEAWS